MPAIFIAWWADYYPWGEVSQISENVLSNEYRFGGQEYDYETEHCYFPFRHYSPQRGTFMTIDPYQGSMDRGNPQSLGRYAYVEGNPTNGTDFLGLTDCPQGKECAPPPFFGPGNPANGCQVWDAGCGLPFGTQLLGWRDPFGDPFVEAEQQYDAMVAKAFAEANSNAQKNQNAATAECIAKGLRSTFTGSDVTAGASNR